MTTLEYMQKQRRLATEHLRRAMSKPHTPEEEIWALEEKLKHYDYVVKLLEKERDKA